MLIDALDGAVDEAYRRAGLDFRARFYPYVRLLTEADDLSVGEFASRLGFTQPAVTQTLALMRNARLVEQSPALDRRQRRFRLTAEARAMLPALRRVWAAVGDAAARLDRSLPAPLGTTIREALARLSETPFNDMIQEELRHAFDADRPDRNDARRASPGAGLEAG